MRKEQPMIATVDQLGFSNEISACLFPADSARSAIKLCKTCAEYRTANENDRLFLSFFQVFFLFSFSFFLSIFFKFFFSLLYQTPKHHKHISHIAPDHWEGVFWNHPGCSPHTGWSRFTDDIRRFTHLPGYAWLDTLMLQHRYFCLCPLQAYMDRVFEMRI